eukprot:TRINITY_DN2826_c0_g1_i2.p2 TRINITY_DN2826_c0_g1~~TRINITY_DN2826_c0_g1_i2.p2  ORF type:complete len:247 (-),score=-14.30 TRINITY_DN2826_c0_g1_i2:18-758(-)
MQFFKALHIYLTIIKKQQVINILWLINYTKVLLKIYTQIFAFLHRIFIQKKKAINNHKPNNTETRRKFEEKNFIKKREKTTSGSFLDFFNVRKKPTYKINVLQFSHYQYNTYIYCNNFTQQFLHYNYFLIYLKIITQIKYFYNNILLLYKKQISRQIQNQFNKKIYTFLDNIIQIKEQQINIYINLIQYFYQFNLIFTISFQINFICLQMYTYFYLKIINFLQYILYFQFTEMEMEIRFLTTKKLV